MTMQRLVTIGSLATSAAQARGAVVIIDVFRAFTTAAIALANGAEAIVMVDDISSALKLRERGVGRFCIGERRGIKPEGFDIGNSPHEIKDVSFSGETLVQTTSNGTRTIVAATSAAILYAASLVNAQATVEAIVAGGESEVWLIAAGDGANRTEEDEICALYMRALLRGRKPDRNVVREAVRTLSPRVDGQTLSAEDVACCLAIDAVPLAVRVVLDHHLCIARIG